MIYQIEFTKQASKQFKNLPFQEQQILAPKIDSLANNPNPNNATKLVGEDNLYRLRVGDYRIIYTIQNEQLLILILKIGHRRDVYR